MPSLPKRPCSYPGGCGQPAGEQGRCPAHPHQQHARGKTAERGYGADHRRLRVLCFERDGWRCVDCGWEPDLVQLFRDGCMGVPPSEQVLEELRQNFARGERHLHADHEIPIEQRPDLRLALGNLRTRCDRCHAIKTAREDGGFGNEIARKRERNRA